MGVGVYKYIDKGMEKNGCYCLGVGSRNTLEAWGY